MIPGALKPEIQELPRIRERLSFIYLEYCHVNREDSAIIAEDKRGKVPIPGASIGVIMLGPGTTITHRAVELLGDAGASIIWVGEKGIRYYAHGRPLTHSSYLLEKQAKAVSNMRTRLSVAREMYALRFPGEDVSHLTMQQLRGREGARIRAVYKKCSRDTGVEWNGRSYDPDNFAGSDDINKALSAANACLYGVVHSIIVSMGCSPGLGFVHTGHERSFVYDIADLYKTEVTIPISFEIVASKPANLGSAVRRAVRDAIVDRQILERCAIDLRRLLTGEVGIVEEDDDGNRLVLWDEKIGSVNSGMQYHEDSE